MIAASTIAFLVLVLGLHGGRRRMVRHVAVADLERAGGCFRFYVAVLGVLIFVSLPDAELPGFVPPPLVTPRRRRVDKTKKQD